MSFLYVFTSNARRSRVQRLYAADRSRTEGKGGEQRRGEEEETDLFFATPYFVFPFLIPTQIPMDGRYSISPSAFLSWQQWVITYVQTFIRHFLLEIEVPLWMNESPICISVPSRRSNIKPQPRVATTLTIRKSHLFCLISAGKGWSKNIILHSFSLTNSILTLLSPSLFPYLCCVLNSTDIECQV